MLDNNLPSHYESELCPSCRADDRRKSEYIGVLKIRKGKFGNFLGCTRYPDCKYTYNVVISKNKYGKGIF